jgi:hypothetical protein
MEVIRHSICGVDFLYNSMSAFDRGEFLDFFRTYSLDEIRQLPGGQHMYDFYNGQYRISRADLESFMGRCIGLDRQVRAVYNQSVATGIFDSRFFKMTRMFDMLNQYMILLERIIRAREKACNELYSLRHPGQPINF